jgi:hypothetical protein
VVDGRLWQRTPPRELGLRFSLHSLRFLMWITAVKPDDEKPRWLPPEQDLTCADLLLFYFAYQALRETEHGPALHNRVPFSRHGLCRLAFARDYMDLAANTSPDFVPWTSGLGACILEVMQRELAVRWIQLERGKGQIEDWRAMQALGRAQEQLLASFFEAIEASGRRDLARFLLEAAAGLLGQDARAGQWMGKLSTAGPRLADRTETYQAATVFLRHLHRLRDWALEARNVGYLDEGYAASQLWKADWEHWQGDRLHDRAQAIIRELEPFHV